MSETQTTGVMLSDMIPQKAIDALDDLLNFYTPKEATDCLIKTLRYVNDGREDEKEPQTFLHMLLPVFREIEYPDGDTQKEEE